MGCVSAGRIPMVWEWERDDNLFAWLRSEKDCSNTHLSRHEKMTMTMSTKSCWHVMSVQEGGRGDEMMMKNFPHQFRVIDDVMRYNYSLLILSIVFNHAQNHQQVSLVWGILNAISFNESIIGWTAKRQHGGCWRFQIKLNDQSHGNARQKFFLFAVFAAMWKLIKIMAGSSRASIIQVKVMLKIRQWFIHQPARVTITTAHTALTTTMNSSSSCTVKMICCLASFNAQLNISISSSIFFTQDFFLLLRWHGAKSNQCESLFHGRWNWIS